MVRIIILACALVAVLSAPIDDLMKTVPGYPETFPTAIYSGYLSLGNTSRAAHYVFVESIKGKNNNDPVTLWLNGGPGCSSLLGFLQQIGPYYLEEGVQYKKGDSLTFNKYSWHNVSNLLFLESPAGVGFSYNTDSSFQYSDGQTAGDNLQAVQDFFRKFPEYTRNGFWLAGESYAGKYIPDLAVLIDQYNLIAATKINFKGMLVGNGVMSFDMLDANRVEYLISKSFIDPEIVNTFRASCFTDPDSAGCRYAKIRIDEDTYELNPYNVFSYCYYNDSLNADPQRNSKSQAGILLEVSKLVKQNITVFGGKESKERPKFNGAPCAYFDGLRQYFNMSTVEYNAKWANMTWNGPCAENITYNIDPSGSMDSYRYILGKIRKYSLVLYNGDWDAVVPYQDTVYNIARLNLVPSYINEAWFTEDQHSGFQQLYSGIFFVTFKGASHQVPQSKRAAALNLFNNTLSGHPADSSIKHQELASGQVEQKNVAYSTKQIVIQ